MCYPFTRNDAWNCNAQKFGLVIFDEADIFENGFFAIGDYAYNTDYM